MIGWENGYWFSRNEKHRVMQVFHGDKHVACTFYAEEGPRSHFNLFERIIDRHRSRQIQPPLPTHPAPEPEM